MEAQLFLSLFMLIFIAELPDKTAFATLLMASRGKALPVFVGVSFAFLVQSLIAVVFGSAFSLFPEKWVHTGAGAMFIAFALHTLLFHDKEEKAAECETAPIAPRARFWPSAAKSFGVIFLAEWGDLTQLATASLAARYHQHLFIVFSAATLALWAVTAIAVVAGKKLGHAIHVNVLKYVGAAFMAAAGIYFIAEAWLNI